MKNCKMFMLLAIALLLTWCATYAQNRGSIEKRDTIPGFFLVAVKAPVGPAFLVSGYRVVINRIVSIDGLATMGMEREELNLDIKKKPLPGNWFVWEFREIKNFRHD